MSSSSVRWLLLIGLLFTLPSVIDRGLNHTSAQPPKGKAPAPPPEIEDPGAKPVKPPPQIDDAPKPDPGPTEGPGETPPADTLVIGVRSLPEFMSPRFARSDSERFALDLLFEGLLRTGADGAGGRVYEPALARDLPALVTLGRAFTLTSVTWADPAKPNSHAAVNAADVVSTVKKLAARKGEPGAEAADWISGVTTAADKECRITLTRGHIDPLSLMTFKVLPAKLLDDVAFARAPIGSGPFMYDGQKTMGGRMYAIFPANPDYKRPNPPRLKAVWMVASRNPGADFKSGLIQFALTNHTGELATLANGGRQPTAPAAKDQGADTSGSPAGKLEVNIENRGHVDTLFGRRIYYLAINHQVQAVGGEKGRDLRRFLAHAIQRDAILSANFRAGFDKHHHPLAGPFPPDTWPCDPKHASSLDDADLARGLRKKGADRVAPLVLKYPDGDPIIAQACKLMAEQVAGLNAGVTLKPIAVDASKFYEEVVFNNDFELAYCHYDYPNDWFSPAGLIDPPARGHGGRNFMGYVPPYALQELLTRCQDRRDFGVVRRAMQQLDASFRTEMPFIPLWHLDTHALLATGLTTVPPAALLDPLAPFTHIEQWTVK